MTSDFICTFFCFVYDSRALMLLILYILPLMIYYSSQ
jgi:hypothetical protein